MIQKKIRQVLKDLGVAIRTADSDGLGVALQELDRLVLEHRREIDPQLLHFLRQRSYQKATAFLDGEEDIPAGICGGRS